MNLSDEKISEAMAECTTCKGTGLWRRGGDKEFCVSCNGTGKVMTEKGRKFKAIVETSQKEENIFEDNSVISTRVLQPKSRWRGRK
jgi:DnaJ-class molecular chaperone